jgi:hypothetical protein
MAILSSHRGSFSTGLSFLVLAMGRVLAGQHEPSRFGGLSWKSPASFSPREVIPAGVALLLWCCSCLLDAGGSNERDWKYGWLGARTYVRTKLWLRGDDGGENAIPDRMSGCRRRLEDSPSPFRDTIRMTSPDGNYMEQHECQRGFKWTTTSRFVRCWCGARVHGFDQQAPPPRFRCRTGAFPGCTASAIRVRGCRRYRSVIALQGQPWLAGAKG